MSSELEDLMDCQECWWQGDISELVCAEDTDGPFNICPDCGAVDSCVNADIEPVKRGK